MDKSKYMGPNRQIKIYGSKNMGSRNWVILTDLKRRVQIGGPNQNSYVTKIEMSQKLKFLNNWNVTETKISLKLK